MKGYVNLTHTNNGAIEKISEKVDSLGSDYVTKDTTELTNYYTKSQTYTKEEVDNKTTNVYRAKGSVQTYQDLPTENNQVGDVYNVIEAYEDYPAGTNFVWTDTSTWDALGGEISVIQGVSQEDFDALVNNETQIQNIENPNLLLIGGATKVGVNNAGIGIGKNAQVQAAGNIAIGENAKTVNYGSVSIGADSSSTGGISLGYAAKSSGGTNAIQLGSGTNTTPNSLQIQDDNIYKSDTHTLTVQNAEINGTPAYGVLSGASAPTTTTVGAVGQFYLDTTNKQLYQCVSVQTQTVDEVDTTIYEWQEVGGSSEKKYMHTLTIGGNAQYQFAIFSIITNDSETYTTADEVTQVLYDLGYTNINNKIEATGFDAWDNSIVVGVYSSDGNSTTMVYSNINVEDTTSITIDNVDYEFCNTIGMTRRNSNAFPINYIKDTVVEL